MDSLHFFSSTFFFFLFRQSGFGFTLTILILTFSGFFKGGGPNELAQSKHPFLGRGADFWFRRKGKSTKPVALHRVKPRPIEDRSKMWGKCNLDSYLHRRNTGKNVSTCSTGARGSSRLDRLIARGRYYTTQALQKQTDLDQQDRTFETQAGTNIRTSRAEFAIIMFIVLLQCLGVLAVVALCTKKLSGRRGRSFPPGKTFAHWMRDDRFF